MNKLGPVQKKIIFVLLSGLALGLSHSPKQYFRTLRTIKSDWKKINQGNFNRAIQKLSDENLVEERTLQDGSFELVLTESGKLRAKTLNLYANSIQFKKPERWDRKWRIIIFDIPEDNRVFRDILREHLHALNFFKLQRSVFVSPYPCEKQILDLVSLYSAKQYVRVITATKIDNDSALKKHFFKTTARTTDKNHS